MISEIIKKYKFDKNADRLGPDCPFTHWRLQFKPLMKNICQKKFLKFDEGADFRAGAYAVTCSKISLGKNVVIRPSTMLFADPRDSENGKIIIEDNAMLGSGVHIYVSNHRYDDVSKYIMHQGHYDAKDVILEEGCWVGANAVLLPGVTIGKNSVVGAGSIVTKDVLPYCVYAGNPAKLIKKLD